MLYNWKSMLDTYNLNRIITKALKSIYFIIFKKNYLNKNERSRRLIWATLGPVAQANHRGSIYWVK